MSPSVVLLRLGVFYVRSYCNGAIWLIILLSTIICGSTSGWLIVVSTSVPVFSASSQHGTLDRRVAVFAEKAYYGVHCQSSSAFSLSMCKADCCIATNLRLLSRLSVDCRVKPSVNFQPVSTRIAPSHRTSVDVWGAALLLRVLCGHVLESVARKQTKHLHANFVLPWSRFAETEWFLCSVVGPPPKRTVKRWSMGTSEEMEHGIRGSHTPSSKNYSPNGG